MSYSPPVEAVYGHFLSSMSSCVTVFYDLRWLITHGNIIKIGYYGECQDMYGGFPWNNGSLDNGRGGRRGRRRSTCVPLYSYTIRGRRYSDTFDTMPETSSIDHREKLGLPPSATHDQNENATFCKACDNLLQSHRIKFELPAIARSPSMRSVNFAIFQLPFTKLLLVSIELQRELPGNNHNNNVPATI